MEEEISKTLLSIRAKGTKEYVKAIGGSLLMCVGIYISSKHSVNAAYIFGCADTLKLVVEEFGIHK